jgi:hypothetical protein
MHKLTLIVVLAAALGLSAANGHLVWGDSAPASPDVLVWGT